jgi:hypothetical protein
VRIQNDLLVAAICGFLSLFIMRSTTGDGLNLDYASEADHKTPSQEKDYEHPDADYLNGTIALETWHPYPAITRVIVPSFTDNRRR